MKQRRRAAYLLGCGLGFFALTAQGAERSDLAPIWGPVACKHQTMESPQSLWDAGLFDAQMNGRFYDLPKGKKISKGTLRRKAKRSAEESHHQGYAFGFCPNGDAWTLTAPASHGLIPVKNGYKIPRKDLEAHCVSWEVMSAAAKGKDLAPRKIDLKNTDILNTNSWDAGTLAVICKPKQPEWLGNQLWFLAPVGKGPDPQPPHGDLAKGTPSSEALVRWINQLRKDAGLNRLQPHDDLDKTVEVLAQKPSIAHDRKLLNGEAKKLAAKNIKLLGEDKVQAGDLKQALWMLWNSPSHRGLLLHAEATHLAASLSQAEGRTFVVIAVGQSSLKEQP